MNVRGQEYTEKEDDRLGWVIKSTDGILTDGILNYL